MTTQPTQADIFAALQAQAQAQSSPSRPPAVTQPYERFASSPEALLAAPPDSDSRNGAGTSGKKNRSKIYCFREGCGSVILSPGVGEWVVLDGPVLPLDPASPFPACPSLPPLSGPNITEKTSPTSTAYWHVEGSPFAFDNIGFSRPDHSTTLPSHAPGAGAEGKKAKVKWLICAECDLGPVGWCFEGGAESWVAVERVRYGEIKE